MCPGHFSRTCQWPRPERLVSNALDAVLNDDLTCSAKSPRAIVALVQVFIRVSDAGPATFTLCHYPTSRCRTGAPELSDRYASGNQSAISRVAESAESEP